jgi:putative endonuclease
MKDSLWFVYLLKCADGSFYCGIAKNVEQRLALHEAGKGARYTRGRGPLEIIWKLSDPLTHGEALKLERRIKRMTRIQKETLVQINRM